MIVYIIVASLAFVAGIGGVIWAVCICTKRWDASLFEKVLHCNTDMVYNLSIYSYLIAIDISIA